MEDEIDKDKLQTKICIIRDLKRIIYKQTLICVKIASHVISKT